MTSAENRKFIPYAIHLIGPRVTSRRKNLYRWARGSVFAWSGKIARIPITLESMLESVIVIE